MMVRKEHTEQIWSYFIEIHRLSLRSPGFKSPSCPWISLWWGEMWILSLPIFILGKKVPPVKIGARSGRKHGKSTRLYWVQIPPSKTPFKGVETDFWHQHVWNQGPYPPSLVKIRLLTKKPKEELYSDSGMGVPFPKKVWGQMLPR